MTSRSDPAADARRDARRTALLDAALQLFATRGYLATPIELLCQEAHVSTKSFYDLFDSREACYLGLMTRTVDTLNAAVSEAAHAEFARHDDERAIADSALAVFASAMTTDPRLAVVLFGKGSATTAQVDQVRRANRRWTATFIGALWQRFDNAVTPPGIITGVVGGLCDVVADWVADLSDDNAAEYREELPTRLANFYWAARAGAVHLAGKDFLSNA